MTSCILFLIMAILAYHSTFSWSFTFCAIFLFLAGANFGAYVQRKE